MNDELKDDLTELKIDDEDRRAKIPAKETQSKEMPVKEQQETEVSETKAPESATKTKSKPRKTTLPSLIMLIVLIFAGYYFMNFLKHSSKVKQFLQANAPSHLVADPQTPAKHNDAVEPNVSISPIATQSAQDYSEEVERMVIPGEVADHIEERIASNEAVEGGFTMSAGQSIENELVLNSQLPDDHYTIQLVSSDNLTDLLEFIKQYSVTNYQIFEAKQPNGHWNYQLIKGNYSTQAQAQAAQAALSKSIPAVTFRIKTGVDVKNEKGL